MSFADRTEAGRHLADPAAEVRAARRWFDTDLAWLPAAAGRLDDPEPVLARPSPRLAELRDRLTKVWAPPAPVGRGCIVA